jgi:hypothetical protein
MKPPKLKTEAVIKYRKAVTYVSADGKVWSNGGMTISRGKPKKIGEKRAPLPVNLP